MLIDTHCHLDAPEFNADRALVAQSAHDAGISHIVVPAVDRTNFGLVTELADTHAYCAYALGIHPLFVPGSHPEDIQVLSDALERQLQSGKPPVAIGEIGLDFFVEGYDRERQEFFFVEQLKLAQKFELPVILHVRRSVDIILKHLRRFKLKRAGIAHAYNGSHQQAQVFIDLGFKLGFGGAMTYSRALHIRELASVLPLESIVLETDAPDIPPEWLGHRGRNTPDQLTGIAQALADLRSMENAEIAHATTLNALQILPGLAS